MQCKLGFSAHSPANYKDEATMDSDDNVSFKPHTYVTGLNE